MGVGLALFVLGFEVSALQQSLPGYYNDDWANGVYLHHQVHIVSQHSMGFFCFSMILHEMWTMSIFYNSMNSCCFQRISK